MKAKATLRDEFAMAALGPAMSRVRRGGSEPIIMQGETAARVAICAYVIADAMLVARVHDKDQARRKEDQC